MCAGCGCVAVVAGYCVLVGVCTCGVVLYNVVGALFVASDLLLCV